MKPRDQEQRLMMSACNTGIWRSCRLQESLRNHNHWEHKWEFLKQSVNHCVLTPCFLKNRAPPSPSSFTSHTNYSQQETLTRTLQQRRFWKTWFSDLGGRVLGPDLEDSPPLSYSNYSRIVYRVSSKTWKKIIYENCI